MPSYSMQITETGSTIWETSNLWTFRTMASDEYPIDVAAYLVLKNESGVIPAVCFDMVDSAITNNISLTPNRIGISIGGTWTGTVTGHGNVWFAGKTLKFRRLTLNNGNGYYTGISTQNGSVVSINTTYVSYNINIDTATGGTVTPSATSATRGTVITLTVTPDDGYELDSISTSAGTLSNSNGWTLTMPSPGCDVTITPVFRLAIFKNPTLKISQSDTTITATKSGTPFSGATYSLHRTTNVDDASARVLIGNFASNSNTYTFIEDEANIGKTYTYELWATYKNVSYFGKRVTFTTLPIHQTVKYYDGSNWIECIPYYYDGSSWIEVYISYYDGSNWIDIDHST